MTSTCKPTRNVALDLIRVVAIVLVLWQHASEYYYIGDNLSVIHANIPLLTWINSVARICVPLFVMISGYLLLPVSTSTATFFRRRFWIRLRHRNRPSFWTIRRRRIRRPSSCRRCYCGWNCLQRWRKRSLPR